jgi:hypothetical protein
MMTDDGLLPITEEWLSEVGFKWHQMERQPNKHWLLWLGGAMPSWFLVSFEDIGIELAPSTDGTWFCWLRSDVSHRYGRFIHIRHLQTRAEVVRLIEGLTGARWDPANNLYGSMHTPAAADRLREEHRRLDLQFLAEPWSSWHRTECDAERGRPLLEHMQAAVEAGKAK